MSLGVPVKLTRPSGQRGVGPGGGRFWPWPGGGASWASTETAAVRARLIDSTTGVMTRMDSSLVLVATVLVGGLRSRSALLAAHCSVAGATSQRLAAGRGRTEHFTGAHALHHAGIRVVATVAREPAVDLDLLAEREAVLLP